MLSRSRSFLAVCLLSLGTTLQAAPPTPADADFFEKEVRPLLAERCQSCHGEQKTRGGLKLTSRDAILKGGETGPAVVVGQPDKSLLIQAIRYAETPHMPPRAKLPEREIAILTRWVQQGLPWPARGPVKTTSGSTFQISDADRRFWSFQPIGTPKPPAVQNGTWARGDVDRFILAALEKKGLHPVAPADKRTLLRRATFDLTGLPPTPAEIDAFLKDDSPNAFARVVDRLLASPQYGERWGRYWLDLVRYTDSFDARITGNNEMDIGAAWRYRDWVVNAFNRDLSYDRFLSAQLAGDLLAGKNGYDRESVVATAMLAIGNWGGGDADKEKLLTDIVDDQIDVVGRTILGLTLACARCHDHKFDPISMADYYGLGGIFFSTHILPNVGPKTNGPPMLRIPLLAPADLAQRTRQQERLAALQKELKDQTARAARDFARSQASRTAEYLLAVWDFQHRSAEQQRLTPAEFATQRGLLAYAFQNWLQATQSEDYVLMLQPLRHVLGHNGVHGWKNKEDTPSALINTTGEAARILTFTLPPRSVSIHPGPTTGVAIGWRSPISGTVRVTGRVVDGDPAGGDGIAWALDHRQGVGRQELAAGEFNNGAAQRFDAGRGGKALQAVAVKEGEMLELVVLPRASHICDTTIVEWTITLADGSKSWTLADDLVNDPLQEGKGNPHPDRLGNRAVWHFYDLVGHTREARPRGATATALHAWRRASTGVSERSLIEKAARQVQQTYPLDETANPFSIRNPADEKYLPVEVRTRLAKLASEQAQLQKTLSEAPPYCHGAQEGGVPGSPHAGVHDVRIHLRGRYDRLGEMVPRRFPEILAGAKQPPMRTGSGRVQLAEWITRPDHPLTARVMVNRLWQFHFGEGLVRTPSNFGKLGQPPTHPELLDWLAREFVRAGWSIKHMHRVLMLSAVYQQSSVPSAELLRVDPDNLWWGRVNRRRLEAEAIRDSLLAVAGKLDLQRGGLATREFNSPRRTLYLMTIRSDRSGFAPLFDTADSTAPVEKRTISTVAPQALFLLNHPFVLEQANQLASRILAEKGEDSSRIEKLYALLFARPPRPEEVRLGTVFLGKGSDRAQAWREYCHLLLCTNEFLYID